MKRSTVFPMGPWGKVKRGARIRATKVEIDGFKFASKQEGAYYLELKLQASAGHLTLEALQDRIKLVAGIVMIPDFRIRLRSGLVVWDEVKGQETDVYRLKRRLWKVFGPGPLRVWKRRAAGFILHEVIDPTGYDCPNCAPRI